MAAGHTVGEVARGLYTDGILIDGANLKDALRETQSALTKRKPIFEGTFRHEGVLIRADVLAPEGDSYRLVEVKSSTSVKAEHLDDATIQSWVISNAGVSLTRIEVACMDSAFKYAGAGYHGLFQHVDLTEDAHQRANAVPQWADAARATLRGAEPAVEPGTHCKDPYPCPFAEHCNPVAETTGFPVETLYRGGKLIPALRDEGFNDLRDVPDDRLTSAVHRRMLRCAKTERPELDAAAGNALAGLPYPRYYLDFETLQTAVPVWPNTSPYAQIPFQWSCHIETASGDLQHHAFLAVPEGDPRRSFAESLVDTISEPGPVFVFNAAFERSRILEVAELYDDLRPRLTELSERLVDLLPIARSHYYHPAMHGSWSLKAILPTIAPELAYDDLDVRDGGMAQEAFAEMMRPDTAESRCAELRAGLLAYCERDTLALVKLAHFFTKGITDAGE